MKIIKAWKWWKSGSRIIRSWELTDAFKTLSDFGSAPIVLPLLMEADWAPRAKGRDSEQGLRILHKHHNISAVRIEIDKVTLDLLSEYFLDAIFIPHQWKDCVELKFYVGNQLLYMKIK